jgi:branched-subunit amino acid aminotransferase/4-amino-4-deoxychorismate lyase
MNPLPILTADLPAWLTASRFQAQENYYAMFSSLWNGIVTDPVLMSVPVDDHLVHRGDGVFETLKCVRGKIYLGREHVARLFASAQKIGLKSSFTQDEIIDVMRQVIRAGKRNDCLVRVLLSRGPGSFGVNPYDCPKAGLYVIAHKLTPSFMDAHPEGARCASSAIPVKPGFFATSKTCNYLPNALMKKEAVDKGVDFTISFDERDKIAEGATENLGLLNPRGELLVPNMDRILSGTTMLRVMELAKPLVARGTLARIAHADLGRDDLLTASEAFIFGTTPDVTAVVSFDGQLIGSGNPGPVARELNDLLHRDIFDGTDHHIVV